MSKYNNYSILMSVYYKENPDYLAMAIDSMLNQTIKSNDFIIVCDGKLTDELYDVINYYESKVENCIHKIQLPENVGLGNALNVGINYCQNEVIARMDSDDISVINRIEKEMKYINEGFELVGSFIDEFESDINKCEHLRYVPEKFSEIKKFSQIRNPFNHPSVIFLKSKVVESGGFIELFRLEDYYLWIRMIKNGVKMCNIPEVLLHMRVNQQFYSRRNTFKLLISMYQLRKYQYSKKMIKLIYFILLMIVQFFLTITPNFMIKKIYTVKLRKRVHMY